MHIAQEFRLDLSDLLYVLHLSLVPIFRSETVSVFSCPVCQSPVGFLPRCQPEINRRYADLCHLSDFFFAAATGSGLKERQTALANKIQLTLERLTSDSSIENSAIFSSQLAEVGRRLLQSIEKAVQDGLRRAGTSKAVTSRDVGLWETQVDIISVIMNINVLPGSGTSSADGDSVAADDSDFLISVLKYAAACTAISRPMINELVDQLRRRGYGSAAQRLKEEMTIWSYERGLWRRCGQCLAFYQTQKCLCERL
jgi:hypothetical protein